MTIRVGEAAPHISGSLSGPHALVFYKVTCPTCQMAAPAFERLETAYPGAIRGVGQDPPEALDRFAAEHGMGFDAAADLEPYPASDAYDIEHVPTLVVVDGEGIVRDVVESWDREGTNRASEALAGLLGMDAAVISHPDDGLPAFRPG